MSGFDQERAPLVDRRQRAQEAFWYASGGLMSGACDGIGEAIEVATRVQITPEIMHDYHVAAMSGGANKAIVAAFRAAGFEVVE